MPNYPGWGFFKFNPWRAKFDQLIMRHIEVPFSGERSNNSNLVQAGLIDEWKWLTWQRMKKEAIARGDVIKHKDSPAIEAIKFEAIQSPLLLIGLCFSISSLVFLVELIYPKSTSKRLK